MNDVKEILLNIVAVLWFVLVLIQTIGLMFIGIFYILFVNMGIMLKTGFAGQPAGFMFFIAVGFTFMITGWVPPFRRCYYILPWLYPFCMMSMMHLFNLSLAEYILAKGYAVLSTPRHVITVILMIVQLLLGRAVMCIYLKKFPLTMRWDEKME